MFSSTLGGGMSGMGGVRGGKIDSAFESGVGVFDPEEDDPKAAGKCEVRNQRRLDWVDRCHSGTRLHFYDRWAHQPAKPRPVATGTWVSQSSY